MTIKYVRNNGQVNGESYRKMAREIKNIVRDEMVEVGKESAKHAHELVGRAGTGRAWHESGFPDPKQGSFVRRFSSRNTRANTGNLRDSLDYATSVGSTFELRVGWVNHYEDYFGFQEKGFSAGGFRPAQVVKGMGILADLRAFTRDKADLAMDRVMERINNGL